MLLIEEKRELRISIESNVYKILIGGDSGVGKTTLVRVLSDDMLYYTGKTIGATFGIKKYQLGSYGKEIILQFWDLSGDSRFRHLLPLFAYGADILLLAFDISNVKTLKSLYKWYLFLIRATGRVPVILVGTKVDINSRAPMRKINKFRKNLPIASVIFTSALKNINIDKLLKAIIANIILRGKVPKVRVTKVYPLSNIGRK
ncbi:MAG: Rab family GTPase [Candidatus Asgardarchaeia archaeon]